MRALVELDAVYCDVIVRRWERFTGRAAQLATTGETFETVAAARAASEETCTSN